MSATSSSNMVPEWKRRVVLLPLYVTLSFLQVPAPCHCQEWTWLAGDKITDKLATRDYPGGRSGSSVWSFNGTMWMFGGDGFTDIGSGKHHLLNDVWSFHIGTKQFKLENPGTWSSRSDLQQTTSVPDGRQHAAMCGQLDQVVVFGGAGEGGVALGDLWIYNTSSGVWQEADSGSDASTGPGARSHCSVWCYGSSMYVFGGRNVSRDAFDDMWRLNVSTLKWEELGNGDDSKKERHPVGRNRATTWISGGILYMFGGSTEFSNTLQHTASLTSDLWRYHRKSNSWQLVSNVSELNQHSGHHAHEDAAQCSNIPGGRVDAASWTDSSGNLWLFGGSGVHHSGSMYNISPHLLSDVWRFGLDDQCWEFIAGSESPEAAGSYGELGKAAEANFPGARTEMMVWAGEGNLIYMFGGLGHDEQHFGGFMNDLWVAEIPSADSREYMISPALLLSFFGVASTLLVVILVLTLYSRQSRLTPGSRLEFRLSPEYYRLENEVT